MICHAAALQDATPNLFEDLYSDQHKHEAAKQAQREKVVHEHFEF